MGMAPLLAPVPVNTIAYVIIAFTVNLKKSSLSFSMISNSSLDCCFDQSLFTVALCFLFFALLDFSFNRLCSTFEVRSNLLGMNHI
jgi:hypothetical protein